MASNHDMQSAMTIYGRNFAWLFGLIALSSVVASLAGEPAGFAAAAIALMAKGV